MEKIFYTDGSSRGNPGPGGWGYVNLQDNKLYLYNSGREDYTTNNRMELTAILKVAKLAAENPDNNYIIYSDSAYAINTISQWMWNWAKNNWTRPKNKPVENLDLIKQLYDLFKKDFFNVELRKVAGHNNILGNELADKLATNNLSEFQKLLSSNSIQFSQTCKF